MFSRAKSKKNCAVHAHVKVEIPEARQKRFSVGAWGISRSTYHNPKAFILRAMHTFILRSGPAPSRLPIPHGCGLRETQQTLSQHINRSTR